MKHNLFLTMLAAALLGSGVANAAGTLYASDYTKDNIQLGDKSWMPYGTLIVNVPLTLMDLWGYIDLYNGATIEFQKEQAVEAICSIFPSATRGGNFIYFNGNGSIYNIAFNDDAQTIIAASAGTPITLIQDPNMSSDGFSLADSTTLTLNGVGYNETVVLDGVEFTYVGPQSSDYTFKAGEIGFTGYENGSHALNLVVGGSPTPEPTTGSLSLLALAGLCARRRK